jgi:hypothetical protein
MSAPATRRRLARTARALAPGIAAEALWRIPALR